MSARGFLGAGDLYIARWNDTTQQFDPYKGPYEANKFEITPKVTIKDLASKSRDGYGQLLESVPLPQPSEFTVELNEVNTESLAIALLGDIATMAQGAGSAVDEVVTASLDEWIPLAHQNIVTAGLTVKDATGATTYVLGTDYNINYRLGWIQAISGGAITDAESLKVSYTYNAISGQQINGMTNAQIRAKFMLDGQNFADGSPVIVEIFEGIVAASSAFDFLANDFNKVTLPGRLKTPTGKSWPFEVRKPVF